MRIVFSSIHRRHHNTFFLLVEVINLTQPLYAKCRVATSIHHTDVVYLYEQMLKSSQIDQEAVYKKNTLIRFLGTFLAMLLSNS